MYWHRVLSWDGTTTRYQSNGAGRWYTIERNRAGVWVLRVSTVNGTPGAVEYRHNCTSLNRAKETANKINAAESAKRET